uniref:Uncharacterized protein n=1 Tax=Streptomyces sp. NBC_00049 TaxID=2903617 RepID=A0AAU2JTX9_9ACTN
MAAGRRIRFTAVLVAVVFALTGFSSHGGSSSGSSGKSKSSGGGGCSSSKSKKKSHSGSSGSTASTAASASASPSGDPATAVVVACFGGTPPVTTIRITSRLDRKADFTVNLYRESGTGAVIEATIVKATLEARETRTVDVALKDASRAAEVMNCRLDVPDDGSRPKPTSSGSTPSGGKPAPTSTSTSPSKTTQKPAPKPAKSR